MKNKKITIALDVHCGRWIEYFLLKKGYNVIAATEGETDEDFFEAANHMNADIYVSADNDWWHHCMNIKRDFIRVPQGSSSGDIKRLIKEKLASL